MHRNGGSPSAVPAAAATTTLPFGPGERGERLEALRRQIRAIERRSPCLTGRPARSVPETDASWCLGVPEIDRHLGPDGLESAALHEIKPGLPGVGGDWAGDWAAALAFALALGVRRLGATSSRTAARGASILWCRTAAMAGDLGRLYAPGLAALGLDPAAVLLVEPGRAADVLWAMEEGLASRRLDLVVGAVREVALTPARRLALAAEATATPCLLLTHPRTAVAGATATRWRIARAPSPPHPFDPAAPGGPAFALRLERCRSRLAEADAEPVHLEWCHETHRFRLVAQLRHRASAARRRHGSP